MWTFDPDLRDSVIFMDKQADWLTILSPVPTLEDNKVICDRKLALYLFIGFLRTIATKYF